MAGKIPEAISEYEAAIRAKPDYAIAHLNLGLMLARQGRLDEAATKFRETLGLEPGNQVARD
jgi:tetratricopeptide (TPR) repeat protein